MAKTISLYGFPTVEPPDDIKECLEEYSGEGTVVAVHVAQPKSVGSRTNAIVEFTTSEAAQKIKLKSLDDEGLWYGNSYLKARDAYHDTVSTRKAFQTQYSMDNITLHFGCQVSKEKFSVLWTQKDVSVTFGVELRKFHFFLTYLSKNYKLELSYENILQIKLHRPCRKTKKYLLVQMLGGPKIFKKETHKLSNFKEATDDQWIRDVDFSPSYCIGQSSALCLELPRNSQLPNLQENFVCYKEEDEGRFILEKGSTFCCKSDLVPILRAAQVSELPYDIVFKVNSLVQHGCLPGPALDARFFRLINPYKIHIAYIQHALEKLSHLKECCYDPARWLQEQYLKYLTTGRLPTPAIAVDDGLVFLRRVQITPTKLYFCGPDVNLSSRVLRKYPDDIDNFLRVSFVDEDLDKLLSTNISPKTFSAIEGRQTSIYQRILSVQRNGITIGSKKFEFLGFSQSQLRESSLWMFASRPGLTAADIREWMGDFREIKNVAKYAARLGQSFSSSRESFNIDRHEIEIIPDIEVKSGGVNYVFSDGIGKISAELADSIAQKLGLRSFTPSAFQIRYGGYKGVVAVDPTSSMKLSLRRSMSKYKSTNTSLDILDWSKYRACFLNREVITLLSTLGVEDQVFERKQKEAIAQLDSILTDPIKAQEALELMAAGESAHVLKGMLACGYKPDAEPFLTMILQTFRASKLLDLRTKSRIFVPEGRVMTGCLDETRTLEYGQAFVQYSRARRRKLYDHFKGGKSETAIFRGKIAVAKNPCLHPGDVQILEAVDVPDLHHMVDCIVFPQKGKRPHTNECSGSDLDGDVYFVCWDTDLIPPQKFPPMDYAAPQTTILDHDVTIEEVQEYFTDYLLNDSLGIICTAHVVFADSEPDMAKSEKCIKLAQLCSLAVDFPKTGVPAKIPKELRVKAYPDFMEKDADKHTIYESQRVLGKLFRAVRDIAPDTSPMGSFTRKMAKQSYDPDMEVDGFKDYINDAFYYKSEYDNKLGNMMDYYGIKTEAEIISGCIMKMGRSFDKKRDLDSIHFSASSLRKQARAWFNESGSDESPDDVYRKASAWYHVTYHPRFWGRYNEGKDGVHFLSFPWCVHDKLFEIKKGTTSLVHQFNRIPSFHVEIGD
ncbi:PREDICTED: probable RNA-dependent RNA polymerase 1 [Populus euphratica]|uniref:RNA-dependent RNA polymerase n=1 Tax=Populus euphratica TaxID=75702 RepID=A0AAJ6U314_POPEU|nr:PREDICTED: probable RNA-dependent RNA polymerase 1 [Populus euphratica]